MSEEEPPGSDRDDQKEQPQHGQHQHEHQASATAYGQHVAIHGEPFLPSPERLHLYGQPISAPPGFEYFSTFGDGHQPSVVGELAGSQDPLSVRDDLSTVPAALENVSSIATSESMSTYPSMSQFPPLQIPVSTLAQGSPTELPTHVHYGLPQSHAAVPSYGPSQYSVTPRSPIYHQHYPGQIIPIEHHWQAQMAHHNVFYQQQMLLQERHRIEQEKQHLQQEKQQMERNKEQTEEYRKTLEREKERVEKEKQRLELDRQQVDSEKRNLEQKQRDLEQRELGHQRFQHLHYSPEIQIYAGAPLYLTRPTQSMLPINQTYSFNSSHTYYAGTSPPGRMWSRPPLSPSSPMLMQTERSVFQLPELQSPSDTHSTPQTSTAGDIRYRPAETKANELDPRLKLTAEPFVPHRRLSQTRSPPSRQSVRRPFKHQPKSPSPRQAVPDADLQRVRQELHEYTVEMLVPNADDPEQALRQIEDMVVRVPAVCFNEQKLEDKEGYQVLHQPQSPAVRGQEAMARVCWALEQCFCHLGQGAFMICDYKYKENYLKQAPDYVLDVLSRPTEYEGSHDLLIIGPQIGVVFVQVTCIETTTNNSTVKKQVRDTLKQLQKDVKFIHDAMKDLDLVDSVSMVMSLPNITTELLRQKLDSKTLQTCASVLKTEDLDDFLTLDCLPCVGQRYWSSTPSRDQLIKWFDGLLQRGKVLNIKDCIQIFARYACNWSQTDVWGPTKPRTQIRTLAHAVAETYYRHQCKVLTQPQHNLLHDEKTLRVLIESPQGSGGTLLLLLKSIKELTRGRDILVFLPRGFTGLRQKYVDELAGRQSEFSGNVYLWSGSESATHMADCSSLVFDPLNGGETKTFSVLTAAKRETLALFDYINRDENLMSIVTEVSKKVTSVWVVGDTPMRHLSPFTTEQFRPVQFSSLTRVPTSIQALIQLAGQRNNGSAAHMFQTKVDGATTFSPALSLMELAENSSYLGLPTDGLPPLFILHRHTSDETASASVPGILDCGICMGRLRDTLISLSHGLAAQSSGQEITDDAKTTRIQFTPEDTVVEITVTLRQDSEAEGQSVLDVNKGKEPKPLNADNILIFTDTPESAAAVVKALHLNNVENIVHLLSDLNEFIGTEKAVVTYVGKTKATAGTILTKLVTKLLEVMTLCQGQLIIAIELEDDGEGRQNEVGPYQTDMEMLIEQAARVHRQMY